MEWAVTSVCVLRTWSPIFGSRLNSFILFEVRLCFCKMPEYINFYSYRIKSNRRDFALSFCVLFLSNLTVVSWRPAFYWRRNRVGVDLGERTWGETGRRRWRGNLWSEYIVLYEKRKESIKKLDDSNTDKMSIRYLLY